MLGVGCSCARRRAHAAFTLVELLVVIGIIGIFAGVIGFALRGGGGSTVGLQASQSILVGLLTQARSQAILTGRNAAVLVHANPANTDRYLRYVVPVVANESGGWDALDSGVFLPTGCYVVPYVAPNGSAVEGGNWSSIRSSALQGVFPSVSIESTTSESWIGLGFTSRGTTTTGGGGGPGSGNIVVATGRPAPGGSSPPFVFTNANGVRGIAVTVYGLTRLLNDRSDFDP